MENMASSQYSDVNVMETSMMSQSSAPLATGESGTLSMRKKSQLKRRITKEHNSNFRAGYVPVNEPYLHKAGIRGRKRFLLYTCFLGLLIVAMLNTALTAWLLWIYRIHHVGLESMEFSRGPAGSLLRFLETARFKSLVLNNASLGSRHNRSLVFTGKETLLEQSRNIKNGTGNSTRVEIGDSHVRFMVDDFALWTHSGKQFFSIAQPQLRVPHLSHLKNLHADVIETRIVKEVPDYDGLIVQSMVNNVKVEGSTGVKVTSDNAIDVKAKNIHLKSSNNTILDGRGGGIQISVNLRRSVAAAVGGSGGGATTVAAKLCVCGNNGRVFAVPILRPGMGCHTANEEKNPCVD